MTWSRRPPKPGDVTDSDAVGSRNLGKTATVGSAFSGLPGPDSRLPDANLAGDIRLTFVEPVSSPLEQHADGHINSIDEFYGKRKPDPHRTIDQTSKPAWSHVNVTNAFRRPGDPRIGFDDDWALALKKARKEEKLSQEQLADAIGTSQNSISLMESQGADKVRASDDVLPACRRLGIPAPQYFASELQKRWAAVGAEFEKNDRPGFESALVLIESTRKGPKSAASQQSEPEKKKSAPKGQRVGMNVQRDPEKTEPLRAPDQLPGETVVGRKKRKA